MKNFNYHYLAATLSLSTIILLTGCSTSSTIAMAAGKTAGKATSTVAKGAIKGTGALIKTQPTKTSK